MLSAPLQTFVLMLSGWVNEEQLAVIDYSKNNMASRLPIQRCPTGAIVWLENQTATKGAAAKKVLRKEPLPIEPAK